MGFFSKLFKHDQELEEQQRKRAMELQVELWQKQAEMGQPVNIQADMEKIYGLDKLEQKQREKQQTKEIIKGAVIGGIVAGDAGAVVGAMVAKNKIDDRNSNQVNSDRNTQYISTTNIVHTATISPTEDISEKVDSVFALGSDAPDAIKFYGSEEWIAIKEDLLNDRNAKTGNLTSDVEYCISHLKVIVGSDLMDILGHPFSRTRPALTPLMDASKVERIEYRCKPYFVWTEKDENAPEILALYHSEYWQSQKESLITSKVCRTGRLPHDIALCVEKLTVLEKRDLAEIMGMSYGISFLDKIEATVRSLEDEKEIVTFHYNKKSYLVKASEYGITSNKDIKKASDSLATYYGSDEWNEVFDEVDAETPTGDLEKDILYCLSRVKVINIWDLSGMWDVSGVYKPGAEHHCMVETKVTALINAGKVLVCEHEDDLVLVDVSAADFIADDNNPNAAESIKQNEAGKFEEIKRYKDLLDSGIITQEEFNTKKKQLLGL